VLSPGRAFLGITQGEKVRRIMRRRTIGIPVAVFGASALAVVLVSTLIDSPPAALAQAPTSTLSAGDQTTVTYMVDPHETIAGSTSIVATELSTDSDSVDLRFDLISFAPQGQRTAVHEAFGDEAFFGHAEFEGIYLRDWVLETAEGPIASSIPNPGVNVVRFPVEQGFSLTAVQNVTIEEYFIATPLRSAFTLSDSDFAKELYPGVSIELLHRSDQDDATIVQVEITAEIPMMHSWFGIVGVGSGWRSAVREAEGGPRWTLTWIGKDLPEDIPLEIAGVAWIEGSVPLHLSLEGLR